MTRHFGFTLAEVLITLGIIGVVAAMTMPTLINQTNGAQFRAAFKKELSVISQAAALNQALEDWDFSGLKNTSGSKLSDLLKARTNVVSEISASTDLPTDYKPTKGGSAWSKEDFDLSPEDKPNSDTGTSVKYFIFNDGSMFIFDDTVENCTDVTVGTTPKKHCHGYFDVNGFKGPNKVNTCDNGTAEIGTECYVKSPTDIFPVIFYDQTILPGSKAGQAVLADRTKEVKANK